MGIYLNPGFNNFNEDKQLINFVDKSMIIKQLNYGMKIKNKLICTSRPRRFGKTMAANMIAAYYSKGCDSHEVFSDLKISKDPSFEENINKYNVLFIDCAGMYNNKPDDYTLVKMITESVVKEFRQNFQSIIFSDNCTLAQAILSVYSELGEKFIIILDEYAILIRERDEKELKLFLKFLNGLFKDNALLSSIALAYLTGIMPIIKDKSQSGLNNFKEYTMLDAEDMAPFMGFTVDEVKALADKNNMDFEEIKRWYDGYNLNGIELYSPKSVITAIEKKQCDDYWTQTSSYDALKDFILMNIEGLKEDVIKMIAGESVLVNPSKFRNTVWNIESKDEVLTCLIHMGYLGFRYISSDRKECFIPNYEINKEWVISIEDSPKYKRVMKYINSSRELLNATWNKEEENVAEIVEKTHMEVTSNLSYNNEASFQSAIRLAYFYADSYYTIINELPAGKGYADIAFIPYVKDVPAMIIELKKDKTPTSAIDQIKRKEYPEALKEFKDNLLLVGISYDSKTKKHICIIERA